MTPFIHPPLSLYIHIPWCVRKCPYCDFNSHAAKNGLPERAYVDALLADLDRDLESIQPSSIQSLFIGGGTPSLFSPESLDRLLAGVRHRMTFAPDTEITLEANPGMVESAKFAEFSRIGIDRLSIGVQSFCDDQLAALGRIHNGKAAIRAAETAHAAGFDNFNLDLMFGLPRQTLAEAEADVRTAIGLEPTHISYYQLTLEPNTLFHRLPPPLPDENRIWTIQQAGQALLATAGYRRYEISAYAREGRECRHNLNYWRFGDYLGIGAGAHGKLTLPGQRIIRRWKIKHPDRYLEYAAGPERIGGENAVPESELPLEFLMNVLRLKPGCEKPLFRERTGLPFSALEPAYSACVAASLLEDDPERLACTETGWNFLDEILQRFIPPNRLI